MRSDLMLLALLLIGCGDGSHNTANAGNPDTGSGGEGTAGDRASSVNGGTGGAGDNGSDASGDNAGSGDASGGTGGSTTTGSVSLTRSSVSTSSSTTGSGGSGGGLGGGGLGGEAGQIFGIGGPCNDSDDCEGGLDCLDADSDSFQVDAEGTLAGPPGGICTVSCESHDDCYALDPDTLCLGVSESEAYCMPFCLPGNGSIDCTRRADMVCRLLPTGDDGGLCSSTAQCGAGQVCTTTACLGVVPVCSPNCATDDDCPLARSCDPVSGLCVDEAPVGADVGEACDQHADCKSQACAEGICSRICTVGVHEACGEVTDPPGAVCWPLYDVTTDLGDMGRCWSLCDCSSDCANGTCVSFQDPDFQQALGRDGFCGQVLSGDIELSCN